MRLALLLVAALFAGSPVAASGDDGAKRAPARDGPRLWAGAAIGLGGGRVEAGGAWHDLGSMVGADGPAYALALRGGVVLRDDLLAGLHLDLLGTPEGEVELLGPCLPPLLCPATVERRAAVNHLSAAFTWLPGGGTVFVRGGLGLALYFEEGDGTDRWFGPGAVAGLGWARHLTGRWHLTLAADALLGRYDGSRDASLVVYGSVGVERR